MMGLLAHAKAQAQALGADLAQAPQEWLLLQDALLDALIGGAGVRAATHALILVFIGGSVEWLYWSYAFASLRSLQATPAGSPRQALRLALRQLVLSMAGVLLFGVATLAASSAFAWTAGVLETVVALVLWLTALRLSWCLLAAIFSPGRSSRRLVPMDSRMARRVFGAAMLALALITLGRFGGDLLEHSARAPHSAGALRFICATLAALTLLASAFAFFGRAARTVLARRARPQFPASFPVAVLVLLVYGLWLLGSASASSVAGIVALLIVLQMVLRDLVFFYWPGSAGKGPETRAASDAPTSQQALQTSDAETQRGAGAVEPALAPSIWLSGMRFISVLLGLGACAIALDTPLADLATRQGPLMRFAFSLLGVAALALLANLAWIAIRSSIDQRLRRIGPPDPHGEPSPEARLLTLLPLLRMASALALGVLLLLSSLWALGIEITPLLAGAGVIGLALGFGAQALVRDVIAGIFFLAEDAFRIGEYIEAGASTKGTVERITLRTVALRHHNGPLHFVPYGALGTVRNNSRDFVVEKFNIPLPIEVDSEKVRKLIKKVGEDMQQDPEVGPLLREPLKGKLYRIDPGVKIFRCKFETLPGKQFDVRAQAYKRLEAALQSAGIGFADGRQTLLIRSALDQGLSPALGAAPGAA